MDELPKRISLVAQTAALLRHGIRDGVWTGVLPGELALCERLQVSRVTLRAALEQLQREGWCRAGQGQRRRILTPSRPRAGGVRADRVVLLSPLDLQQLPASTMFWVDALRDHLAAVGYRLEVVASHAAFSRHPARVLGTLVGESPAAAWVLYLSTVEQQRWFAGRHLPCVVSGTCHEGVGLASVDQDYAATCAHAVGLLAGRGRRQLAFLMPRSGQAGNLESERGFLEAVARLDGVEGRVVHHEGSVPHICQVLDRLLRLTPPVTGLLVAKPAHVTTTLTHLLRRGVLPPRDISLISRDDDPLLETLVPVVSRYHIGPAVFARRISRAVTDLVRSGVQRPRASQLMPVLIPGETLGEAASAEVRARGSG